MVSPCTRYRSAAPAVLRHNPEKAHTSGASLSRCSRAKATEPWSSATRSPRREWPSPCLPLLRGLTVAHPIRLLPQPALTQRLARPRSARAPAPPALARALLKLYPEPAPSAKGFAPFRLHFQPICPARPGRSTPASLTPASTAAQASAPPPPRPAGSRASSAAPSSPPPATPPPPAQSPASPR